MSRGGACRDGHLHRHGRSHLQGAAGGRARRGQLASHGDLPLPGSLQGECPGARTGPAAEPPGAGDRDELPGAPGPIAQPCEERPRCGHPVPFPASPPWLTAALVSRQTYSVDRQVPDSASTGTAYLCGVKANAKTLGVSAAAQHGKCGTTFGNEVDSVLHRARRAGKSGLVHVRPGQGLTGSALPARAAQGSPALWISGPSLGWPPGL